MARLTIVVPVVIGLIFLLLFLTFGNVRQAALILLAIPFAMVGGLVALLVGGSICRFLPPLGSLRCSV